MNSIFNRKLEKWGMAILMLLAFTNCEKAALRYAEMRQYHQESTILGETSQDSISRFSQKVDAFVGLHPSAKDDPLYPEIEANIRQARLAIHIEGETYGNDVNVEFEFGGGTE